MKTVLGMILAGGEGKRLFPLTADRAKPAVPFAGKYRIIDFVLNNFVHSGIYRIKILTQFKSDSLNRHITRGWPMPAIYSHYIDLVPAQMRTGNEWYKGTADAIYQNLNLISDETSSVDYVAVFGGDHIYRMDISQMVDYHQAKKANLTIAAIPVPVDQASEFGVIEVDADYRVVAWQEKPKQPKEMPDRPGWALASMGNYIFDKDVLVDVISRDANKEDSRHDFGHDIILGMLKSHEVFVYDFSQNQIPGIQPNERGYWRDVGTLDAYWEASMDLVSISPQLNLYNPDWPIQTFSYQAPPAKFVFSDHERRGVATDSLVSDGCIISGGQLSRCILSPYVRINSFSQIEDSILMHGVNVGRYARIRKAIIDKGVDIPPHTRIGYNADEDRARGFTVSPGGVTAVPKGMLIPSVNYV